MSNLIKDESSGALRSKMQILLILMRNGKYFTKANKFHSNWPNAIGNVYSAELSTQQDYKYTVKHTVIFSFTVIQ